MADDEDFDLVDDKASQLGQKRPVRVIEVREHDTNKAMTDEIIELAQVVLDGISAERCDKDVATSLKQKLDEKYGGTWHAIVGSHFGGNVTNDEETLANFKIDGVYYLVLRSGPPDRPAVAQEEDAASA